MVQFFLDITTNTLNTLTTRFIMMLLFIAFGLGIYLTDSNSKYNIIKFFTKNKKIILIMKWIVFLPLGYSILLLFSFLNWLIFSFALYYFVQLNFIQQIGFYIIWLNIFLFTLGMYWIGCYLAYKISPNIICYFIVTFVYLLMMLLGLIKYSNELVPNDPTIIQIPTWLFIIFFIREIILIFIVGIKNIYKNKVSDYI